MSFTATAIERALEDGVVSLSDARDIARAFQDDDERTELPAVARLRDDIARGRVHADAGALAMMSSLLLRGAPHVVKRTATAIVRTERDVVVDKGSARALLAAVDLDGHPAAERLLGETYERWLKERKVTELAQARFEIHFESRDLPYGANRAPMEARVKAAMTSLKPGEPAVEPDTRPLHEVKLGFEWSAFVDVERQLVWHRWPHGWLGPVKLPRGPRPEAPSATPADEAA